MATLDMTEKNFPGILNLYFLEVLYSGSAILLLFRLFFVQLNMVTCQNMIL